MAAYGVFCDTVEQIATTPFASYASDPCKTQRDRRGARRSSWLELSASSDSNINPAVISVSLSPGSAPCDIGDNRDPTWAPVGFQPK